MRRLIRTVLVACLSFLPGCAWQKPGHALAAAPLSREHPAFLEVETADCEMLAKSVNHYVGLGRERALEDLLDQAKKCDADWKLKRSRVASLARILFGTSGVDLRPPRFGWPFLPDESMPPGKWPLYPMVRSGRSYFVMSEGYILAGVAEKTESYVRYCSREGRFRKSPVPVPSAAEAKRDLQALIRTPLWRSIKWSHDEPHNHYQLSEAWVISNMEEQIPAEAPMAASP